MYICLNRATAGGSLPLEQFVALAATVGFHGADVDLSYAETSGIAALKDLYARHKLRFGTWGLPFDWRAESSKQAEGLKKLAAQAKIAAELRIDACATWLMPSSDLPLMDNWKFHVDRLKPAAALLAQHGLRLGLEFIGPYHLRRKFKHEFLHTAGQMLELADAIGPNAGLLVNSFHCHTSGMRWEHLAQIPASRIVLVHLNDAPNLPCNEVEDGNRCLPGEGVIDLVHSWAHWPGLATPDRCHWRCSAPLCGRCPRTRPRERHGMPSGGPYPSMHRTLAISQFDKSLVRAYLSAPS